MPIKEDLVEFKKRIVIQDSKHLLRISPPKKRALSYTVKVLAFLKGECI